MQIRQFKAVLAQISSTLEAAKADEARAAVQNLEEALAGHDGETVEQIAIKLEAPANDFVSKLAGVGLDEGRFLAVLGEIEKAKLKKLELQALVKSFVGQVDTRMSAKQLVDRIKLEFYERIYEQASHKLAQRATPY